MVGGESARGGLSPRGGTPNMHTACINHTAAKWFLENRAQHSKSHRTKLSNFRQQYTLDIEFTSTSIGWTNLSVLASSFHIVQDNLVSISTINALHLNSNGVCREVVSIIKSTLLPFKDESHNLWDAQYTIMRRSWCFLIQPSMSQTDGNQRGAGLLKVYVLLVFLWMC